MKPFLGAFAPQRGNLEIAAAVIAVVKVPGKNAADFIFASQKRRRSDRERALRDQSLLGDVCLLRLERFHLYHGRNS